MDCEAEFVFVWKVSNCPLLLATDIESPIVCAENINGSKYRLLLNNYIITQSVRVQCMSICDEDQTSIKGPDVSTKIDVKSQSGVLSLGEYVNKKLINKEILHELSYSLPKWYKISVDENIIIECHVKSKAAINSKCVVQVDTRLNFDRSSFEWIMSNIDVSNLESKKKVLCGSLDFDFEIILSFLKDTENCCTIKLEPLREPIEYNGELTCQVTLMDNDKLSGTSNTCLTRWWNKEWLFPPLVPKSLLLLSADNYLINNTFTLKFDFYFPKKDVSSSIKYYDSDTISDAHLNGHIISSLQNDLRYMFANGLCSDVTFQVEKETFSAHRGVLSARSSVFRTMFEEDMEENKSGVVNITDFDTVTFKAFLNFMYSGQVDATGSDEMFKGICSKLLLAADKYDVQSLKNKCSKHLSTALTAENVCEILSIADVVGANLLKNAAIDFIKIHSSKVLPSEEWRQLIMHHPKLTTEVLCKFSALLEIAI